MAFSGLIKCSGYMSFFHDVIIFALGNSADEFLLLKVKGYVYRFAKFPIIRLMLHAAETISGIAAFSALIIFDGVCGGIGRQSAFIKIGFFAVAA
jgi:hypothetical protein